MALIVIPYVFASGNTIIALQHNSNFSTIANCLNGLIDNTNISPTAGILYSQLNLGGNIVNADIGSGAAIVGSKIVSINGATQITGSIPVAQLASGTATTNYVPMSTGTSAVPAWTAIPTPLVLSNVLFQWHGQYSSGGYYSGSSNVTQAPSPKYSLLAVQSSGTILTTQFTKIAGINTVTVYATIWSWRASDGSNYATLSTTIGSLGALTFTGNVIGTFESGTINVSSLTNGSTYTVTIALSSTTDSAYCGDIIAFGS